MLLAFLLLHVLHRYLPYHKHRSYLGDRKCLSMLPVKVGRSAD